MIIKIYKFFRIIKSKINIIVKYLQKYFNSKTIDDISFKFETEKRGISLNRRKRYIKDCLYLKIEGMRGEF